MTNQPCTACGWTLSFDPARNGWACDRCQAFVPQGAPLPSPSESPWAPPGGSAARPVTPPAFESAYAPHPPSPYAPPVQGMPAPAPYVPQPVMPYPPPAPPAVARAANRKMLFVGLGAAGAIGVIVLIVVLTRSSGGASSRAEVVNETFAALAAGDVERLVKLVDPKNLFARVLDCRNASGDDKLDREELEREFREKSLRLIDKVKGRRFEVISIENKPIDRDHGDGRAYGGGDRGVFEKGDNVLGGCRAKETFRAHELIVVVAERKGEQPAQKKRAKLELLEVDGDWYLVDAPRGRSGDDLPGLGEDDDDDDALAKMTELKDQMCRCSDADCARRVTDAMTKWGEQMGRRNDERKPSSTLTAKLEIITKQFGDCMTKAMSGP